MQIDLLLADVKTILDDESFPYHEFDLACYVNSVFWFCRVKNVRPASAKTLAASFKEKIFRSRSVQC